MATKAVRPPRLTKPWEPKEWRPEYERVVAMSCLGYSAQMIIDKLSAMGTCTFTKQHISNILNTEKGEALRHAILAKMREKTDVAIPQTIEYIAGKTVERMKTLIDNDEKFDKSPFAVIGLGLKFVEGLGHFKAGKTDGGTHIDKAIFINADTQNALMEGLKKANEVQAMLPAAKKEDAA